MAPAELIEEPERGIKPGMGRREREARLGSGIFIVGMVISAPEGLASTGSESAGC